ncbi:MAG: hypothetical protein H6978_06250 [Gammaproteobacteria bacterium]|nr:hypothetical protein [Gammaproteobacteria bacterium]
MKTSIKRLSWVLAATLSIPALAHHSFAMFDRDTEIVKTATVQRWAFNNPHSWLYVNITNEDGSKTLLSLEGASPTQLIPRGITGSTFEPGDTLLVMYCPLRDGRPGGGIGWAKLADGRFVSPADGGCNGNDASISRWQEWLKQGYTTSKEATAAGK